MYKERFKSILLVFLIMTNFVLGSKILTDKKLWPDGYNFFYNSGISKLYANIVNYFSDNDHNKSLAFTPDKIIINTGDQTTRISLNSSNDEFYDLYAEAEKLLKSAFSDQQDNISTVSVEELYSALSSGSVYLDYSTNHSIKLFCDYFGIKAQLPEAFSGTFSGIVISHSPRTSVYISDIDNGAYYRINLSKNTETFVSLCKACTKKYSQKARPVINYSFDLKFDQPFGSQKTTLNPLIQIYSTSTPYNTIQSKNPLFNEDLSANELIVNEILKVFEINPNTMRRYTEAGGTLVFVENDGILKIHTNGFLEYEATASGLRISKDNTKYFDISNALSMVADINEVSGFDGLVRLSECPDENTLNFDYVIEGMSVKITDKNIDCGIKIVTEDGFIKSYKQLIRDYSVTEHKVSPTEFFTALDNTIAKYSDSMNKIRIDKMYICYSDNGTVGEKRADWTVDVNNIIVGE